MADDDAHMLVQGAAAINDAKTKMRSILEEIENIRRSLWSLRTDVKEFQEKCNVAKTVGTTSSVVGAGLAVVGLAGAFFTAGTSLLLTAGSLGTTVAGAGVNITTDLINRSETKDYIKKIDDLVSGLQGHFNELEDILAMYTTAVERIMKIHGLDENTAAYFINQIKEKFPRITKITIMFSEGAAAFKAAVDLSKTIKVMKSIGTFTKTATGGTAFTITKSLGQLTEVEKIAIGKYAPIAFGRVSVIGKVFKGALIAVNVGFAVWDIISLVKDWKSKHPAVETIDDALGKLKVIENQTTKDLAMMERIG